MISDRCVYLHSLDCGRVFYVGIGSLNRARSKASRNRHWNFLVKKHGKYNVLIIARNLTIEEAASIEKCMIAHIGVDNLTNISLGGEASAYGMRHSEESKRKISLNSSSRRPEVREKHRQNATGEKNNMYGKTHTQEARKRIANARTGSKASSLTKAKMSCKRQGINNASYNPTVRTFEKDGLQISCSAYHFRILTGIDNGSVSMLVNGLRQSAKGWKYVE